MLDKINDIQNKLNSMNEDEINKVNQFILKLENKGNEIDKDFYLNFDWLQDVEEKNNYESNESELKNLAIKWRTMKNVPR